jgi:DNA-binding transcriptional ArsR family regulator
VQAGWREENASKQKVRDLVGVNQNRKVQQQRAAVFAALGDETRLSVLARLSSGSPQSIARLTEGTKLTRQAVTKHLRVLEAAGVVISLRAGRESLFELEPKPLHEAQRYLDHVSRQWDDALGRLKALVEE